MKNYIKIKLPILLILVFSFLSYSESNFEEILKEIKKEVFLTLPEKVENPEKVLNIKFPFSLTEEKIKLKKMELEFEKYKTGLNFEARYRYNQKTDFFTDSDIPYRWRGYLGITWNLFRNGYFESKKARELMEKNLEVEEKITDYKKRQEFYPLLDRLISYLFLNERMKLIAEQEKFYKQYFSVARDLYFKNYISREKIEEIKLQYFTLKKEIENYKIYYPEIESKIKKYYGEIDVSKLPVFPLNLERIKNKIRKNPFDEEFLSIQKELQEFQNRKIADITLQPFFRYYFGDEDDGNRGFFAFGIELEIPIPLPSRKKITEQQLKIMEMESARVKEEVLLDVDAIYSNYDREIKDIAELLFEREILKERITKQLIKYELKDPSFSILDFFEIYSEFLQNKVGILEKKERIYRYLSSIYRYIPDGKIEDLFLPVEMSQQVGKEIKIRKGERCLFINSYTFNNPDNDFILWFLKVKEIKEVVINISDINEEKLKDFIRKAKGKFILIGYGNPEKIEKLDFDGILLNEINVDKIKTLKRNKVFVLFKKTEIKKIKGIIPFANKVFLDIKNKKFLTFLKNLKSEERNKTGILISLDGYTDESEVEKKIDYIAEKYGIKNFILYSFKNFVKW